MIAFIQIGNSDDKLTQAEWVEFIAEMRWSIRRRGELVGEWFSAPDRQWQNACWMIKDLSDTDCDKLAFRLSVVCKQYRQDSIAYTVAEETRFIPPHNPEEKL